MPDELIEHSLSRFISPEETREFTAALREVVENGKELVTTPEHAASLLTQQGEWEPAKAAPEKEV